MVLYNEHNRLKSIVFSGIDNGGEVKIVFKMEELTQILSYSGEKFKISQITNNYELIPMNSIFDITINCVDPRKKIFIWI